MAYSLGPTIVKDGLVFAFDAANPRSYPGSGSNSWINLSGTNNISASIFNSPVYNTYNGGSLTFDGVDDIAISVLSGSGQGSVEFSTVTVSAWARANDIGSNRTICSANFNAFALAILSSTASFLITGTGSISEAVAIPSNIMPIIQTGSWYMLTGVFGGSSVEFYVNGQLTAATSSYLAGHRPPSQFGFMNIGRSWRPRVGFFNGDIAQLHIYNRGLTASEVLQNYKASKGRYGLK